MSDHDPFAMAPDPADEPTPEPENPPAGTATSSEPAEPSEFHPYKITLKSGSGYEAEWLTASYKTLEDLERDFSGPRAAVFARILPQVNKVAAFFRNGGPGTGASSGSSGGGNRTAGKPEGAAAAPSWMGSPPSCEHGTKKYVSKTRADGSVWHAWGCPGAKGNQCSNGLDFRNPPK